MKRNVLMAAVISVLLVSMALDSLATQVAVRRAGGQGWGANTLYGSMFDPKTLQTIRGQVLSVETFTPLRQMGYGLLVMVQAKDEVIAVHVGPGWYVEEQNFQLEKGDQVVVSGSRMTFNEQPAIIATQVSKGDEVLRLRRDNGTPVWSEEEDEA